MLLCAPVQAEINVLTSVEWLACKSETVAIGQISEVKTTAGPNGVTFQTVSFTIDEILKGGDSKMRLEFVCRIARGGISVLPPSVLPKKDAPADKKQVIVFLSTSKGHHRSESFLDGKLIPTPEVYYAKTVIDLERIPEDLVSKKLTPIRDKETLLKISRSSAKSPIKQSLNVDLPSDYPDFSKYWAGSSVMLIVPADEEHRKRFVKMAESKDVWLRAHAASELKKYPGEETEKLLWELTKDTTTTFSHYAADIIAEVTYPVREAAFRSLQALHDSPEPISVRRKPTAEERRKLRETYWKGAFKAALPEGYAVASVTDLETRAGERWPLTKLRVVIKGKGMLATFHLVPFEWPKSDLPKMEALGQYAKDSQGSRYFYVEGAVPEDLKEKIIAYFGVE